MYGEGGDAALSAQTKASRLSQSDCSVGGVEASTVIFFVPLFFFFARSQCECTLGCKQTVGGRGTATQVSRLEAVAERAAVGAGV